MSEDTATCIRCGQVLPISSDELLGWEVIGDAGWCCEACLTPADVQAIDAEEMKTADEAICSRCGAGVAAAETGQDVDGWVVEDDGSLICSRCRTFEDDRAVDEFRIEMGLGEYRGDASDA